MPMDLVYDEIEKARLSHKKQEMIYSLDKQKTLRFNGYTTEDAGCKALLAIVPKAYVGWARQFQQYHQDLVFAEGGFKDGQGAWWVADATALQHDCGVDDAEAVITRLWDMYFEGEERSLVRFEDVIVGLIELHQNWVKVE